MRLRTALKIQRAIEDPWRLRQRPGESYRLRRVERCRWRPETIWKSRTIGRRKWSDRRMPYVPNNDELDERLKFGISFLADALIDDDDQRDEFKTRLWSES